MTNKDLKAFKGEMKNRQNEALCVRCGEIFNHHLTMAGLNCDGFKAPSWEEFFRQQEFVYEG